MTLLSAGWNQFGQLGREGDGKTPSPVNFPPTEYRSISVGQLHTIVIDNKGDAYGWGSNEDGGLSFKGQKEIRKPMKIEINEKISLSACGYCNTVLLSESGNVYIINDQGPWKVGLPEPCIFVCCGYYIIWAVGRNGSIYQCPDVPEDPYVTFTIDTPATKIAAGNGFAVAITENGQAYGNGEVVSTLENEQGSENTFVKIDSLKGIHIKKISAFDSHCIAVSNDGRVFVWGHGGQGKLGTGNCENCTIFQELKAFGSEKIADASAGTSHSCFVTENGNVYGCGSNENGQALLNNTDMTNTPEKSTIISGCVAVQCGGHTLAIVNGKPPTSSNDDNEEVEKTKGANNEEGGDKKGKSNCCLLI